MFIKKKTKKRCSIEKSNVGMTRKTKINLLRCGSTSDLIAWQRKMLYTGLIISRWPVFYIFFRIFYFYVFLNWKNHISWLMYQFHYMHDTRGWALNWPCTRYLQYSGIVTLIKKYDFFSEILLSKSDKNWKFQIKPACVNLSNMHWKCIFKGIVVAYNHIEGLRIGLK